MSSTTIEIPLRDTDEVCVCECVVVIYVFVVKHLYFTIIGNRIGRRAVAGRRRGARNYASRTFAD